MKLRRVYHRCSHLSTRFQPVLDRQPRILFPNRAISCPGLRRELYGSLYPTASFHFQIKPVMFSRKRGRYASRHSRPLPIEGVHRSACVPRRERKSLYTKPAGGGGSGRLGRAIPTDEGCRSGDASAFGRKRLSLLRERGRRDRSI